MTKLYQKIFDEIEQRIITGVYELQTKLPSEAQLAQEYGVSSITIKRALQELSKLGYISRKPKQGTIVVANRREDEVINTLSGGVPMVGCVFTNFDDIFGTKILSGIIENSVGSAHIIMKKSMGDVEREEALIKELVEANVSGIILLPCSSKYISPSILELVYKNFPIIIVDRALEGIPISSVSTDNKEANEKLTAHLIERGHRHIGLITSSLVVSSIEERIGGYVQVQDRKSVV